MPLPGRALGVKMRLREDGMAESTGNPGYILTRRALLTVAGALVVGVGSLTRRARALETAAPLSPERLASYVRVEPDGSVVALYGKVESGQGLTTAMAQIVAEELDVSFGNVRVIVGDSALTLNLGGASGATGVAKAGALLRDMAAEARRLLLELASRKLGAPVDALAVNNGVVSVAAAPERRVAYAELLADAALDGPVVWNGKTGTDLAAKGAARPKPPGDYRVVGETYPRLDLVDKVMGRAEYVNDVRLPGMVHVRMIRPPVAGAVPEAVDEASIAGISGAQVVRVKDLIAVVAPREWDAIRALRALRMTWTDSQPGFPGDARLHEHIRAAPVAKAKVEKEYGALDAAFARAVRVVGADYESPTQSHASMGPACAVADVRADSATLWTSTQKPHYAAEGVAKLVGLPPEKVRAIWMFGTGSYGRNDQGDAGADAAVLSKALGRPVRVQYMREEALGWDPKSTASIVRSRAAIDASGAVIGYEHLTKGFSRVNTDTKEGSPGATLAGQIMGAKLSPKDDFSTPITSYDFGAGRLRWETIAPLMERASPLRTTHLRDPHGFPVLFGSEGFMDELASATDMDAVAFRLRYLKHPRERAVVEAVAARAGWLPRVSPDPEHREAAIARGRGLALRRHTNTFIALVAEVAVHRATGRVEIERLVCAADVGLVVNPGVLRHVIECQLVYGTSRALREEVRFDASTVTSIDWETYPVLHIDQAPARIDIEIINRRDMASSGAAEMGPGLVAPALANAIFDATGARIRRLPLTPERVKTAIERA